MNADGSSVRQLTNATGYDGGPFISPDGQWVVFRSDRKEEDLLQLHVIGIDGKHEVRAHRQRRRELGAVLAPHRAVHHLDRGRSQPLAENPQARPNYDLWLMKYSVKDGEFSRGPMWRITDHAVGRRAAGLLARRQAAHVDRQPRQGRQQQFVDRGLQTAEPAMKLVIHPSVEHKRLQTILEVAGTMRVVNARDEAEALREMPDADAFFGKLTPPTAGGGRAVAMGAIADRQPGAFRLPGAGRASLPAHQHARAVLAT